MICDIIPMCLIVHSKLVVGITHYYRAISNTQKHQYILAIIYQRSLVTDHLQVKHLTD